MTVRMTTPMPAKRTFLLRPVKGAVCFSVDALESLGNCLLQCRWKPSYPGFHLTSQRTNNVKYAPPCEYAMFLNLLEFEGIVRFQGRRASPITRTPRESEPGGLTMALAGGPRTRTPTNSYCQ
jgi:hypothetical protein